jgi:hypothetical protein
LTSYHPFHYTIYNIKTNKFPHIKKIKFVDFAEKYIKEHAKPLKKSTDQVIYFIAVPDKFQGVHKRFQLILEEFQVEAALKK